MSWPRKQAISPGTTNPVKAIELRQTSRASVDIALNALGVASEAQWCQS